MFYFLKHIEISIAIVEVIFFIKKFKDETEVEYFNIVDAS
jgi:hypothetical protein